MKKSLVIKIAIAVAIAIVALSIAMALKPKKKTVFVTGAPSLIPAQEAYGEDLPEYYDTEYFEPDQDEESYADWESDDDSEGFRGKKKRKGGRGKRKLGMIAPPGPIGL